MMSYSEFCDRLLVAIMLQADATLKADPNSLGIVDPFRVADTSGLRVQKHQQKQWISDAVETFETRGWVCNVVRPLSGDEILLMITGEGRKQAERTG